MKFIIAALLGLMTSEEVAAISRQHRAGHMHHSHGGPKVAPPAAAAPAPAPKAAPAAPAEQQQNAP